jgi:monoterpene epsilon-lactone hydrolase
VAWVWVERVKDLLAGLGAPDDAVERVVARIRAVYSRWHRHTTADEMRRDWDALFAAKASSIAVDAVDAGGVPGEWVRTPGAGRSIFFLHGGGYQIGSPASHRGLVADIARAAGAHALSIDYRLAPEHRYPAALDDALSAYRWLLEKGVEPARLAIAGDSAGGGLAIALLYRIRALGLPLPAAGVLLSPWTDMEASGESYASRAALDPIHQRPMLLAIYGDPAGLPPLLVQVGERETIVDDARLFAEKSKAAGVPVEFEIWPGMIHVFQMYTEDLADARRAVTRIGEFLRRAVQ